MIKRTSTPDSGRYAYEGLDRLMHEKARLGILTSLVAHAEGLPFNDLKDLCRLTDGNLSRHLTTLQEAGIIEIQKGKQDNRSLTQVKITPHGREKFLGYLNELENVIRDAMPTEKPAPTTETPEATGWSPA
jgi:DNA-binding MarR family transcriptional regulator